MSDQPVAELFADLGFDVDREALSSVDRGLKQIETSANRAVAAVDAMGGALARSSVGGKQGFWSGIKQSFQEGMAQGAQPRPGDSDFIGPAQQKAGLFQSVKDSFKQGWREGLEESQKETAHTKQIPVPVAPHTPGQPPKTPHDDGAHGGGGAVKGLTGILEHAQHVMHGFLGLFAAHEIQHFAHELMDASSALELTSARLGISTEALQELQFAANMSDIGVEELTNSLKFLQISSTKAGEGGKAQAKIFRELGIAVKDADGHARPVDELLGDVAEGFTEITDPAKQTAIAVQLFGRSGAAMVPFLQKGRDGIHELREEAAALGGGLTETLIENAGHYEEALKRFNFAFLGVKSAIGNFLLPVLTKLSQAFTTLAGWFNTISSKTKYWQTLLGVGLAVALGKVILYLNTIGTAGVLAWLKNIGPAILLTAVIAGVTLVLEDLYQALTGGKSAIGKWLDEWQGIGTTSELVRNIAAGIDSITQAIKNFASSPWESLQGFMQDIGYVLGASPEELGRRQDEIANRAVATGRGLGADAQSNIDIPRALGRGLNADAVSSFGQSRGSIFDASSANRDSSSVNVTINAQTGASPKEIAHHAKRAIEEHQQKQNRNLRRALVPHAER